jgi:hypothetical protein
MTEPARTPTPPYYAVIFTSLRTVGDNGDRAAQLTRRAACAHVRPDW